MLCFAEGRLWQAQWCTAQWHTSRFSAGVRRTVLLTSDDNAKAFGMNVCGQCNIPLSEEGIKFIQVSAGQDHTVLLRSDGHVVICGKGGRGQGTQTPLPGTWDVADLSLGRGSCVATRLCL